MSSRRLQRLNVLFQQELADLIAFHLRDPRLAELVSITRVEVSADLQNAHVHVSVLGDEEAKASTMTALQAAAPFLRRQLSERLTIRRIPGLHFRLDESIEEAAHILELMKQVPEKKSPP
ncbi:MAG TPA: 30S ribosome-binding factor RbfA [Dehalococcoidia bacterium]|nr:30S ribosome-binding factor RbfA [Dehalococcoidia bacterium]